jgi:hypothetical protein
MTKGKRKSAFWFLILFVLGTPLITRELSGQIGGFIKKRVKDAVSKPAENTATTEQESRFNDRVLELNADNLAKLENALLAEKQFRDGVEARYAKIPSREQYQNCMGQVAMSDDAHKIMASLTGDTQQYQQAMNKLNALYEEKCGKDPSKANKSEDLRPAIDEGAKGGGLTRDQYSIMKERILPFCSSGGQNKVRGEGGSNIFYVYSQTEVSAIQPQCGKLAGLIKGLNAK